MPPSSGQPFEYLKLVCRKRGKVRNPPRPIPPDPSTAYNRKNRSGHSSSLRTSARSVSTNWQSRQAGRQKNGLPVIEAGVPLLLKIDTSLDLDEFRRQFQLEIVSEQEEGYLLVAAQDISLSYLEQKLTDYVGGITGSANLAKVHEIIEDLTQEERLQQVFSDVKLSVWRNLNDQTSYIFDISIACEGDWEAPKLFTPRKNWGNEANARHAQKRNSEISQAYQRWDDLQYSRSESAKEIISAHKGDVIGEFHGEVVGSRTIPDYFTLRVKMTGAGVRDLVLNFPYVFEVVEPVDIETPQQVARQHEELQSQLEFQAPAADSPFVCIVDSGIQEEHIYLADAVDTTSSRCFLPGVNDSDIADYVPNGGHGTRVAGVVAYGEDIPDEGTVQHEYWIQNARVLDSGCKLPENLLPASMIRDVVTYFHDSQYKTRIFNQ